MPSVKLSTRVIPAGPDAVTEAARCLAAGGLVAFPTETVYGLGADASSSEAIARLYAAKGRPSFNPLIAHVDSLDTAHRLAQFNSDAERLTAFWPGPLTLVLAKRPNISVADLATAGLDTIALRMPAHPAARDLLRCLGKPIVAPSANRSGHVSPTTAGHVLTDLDGRVDIILDGGPTQVGMESTIVACLDAPVLLRPGGLTREAIERALGQTLLEPPTSVAADASRPLAPGMLASHYAPRATLRLNASSVEPGEALLAFGPPLAQVHDTAVRNLSPRGDLIEAAANFYSHLRALDAAGVKTIAVMPIPHQGLGDAINDRLARAAGPRG